MIKTIVIEDEAPAADILLNMLKQHFKEVQVVAAAASVPEATRLIAQHQPDLVLSDIQLGKSYAFEIFQNLPEINFEVIFISAYERFAIQAIKFSALDYLLKPYALADLKQALDNFTKKLQQKQSLLQFETLFHNLRQMQKDTKRIALPTLAGLEVIGMNEIIRCQSQVNYTYFYLTHNRKFVISRTLKEYDDMLQEYDFLRVHNSHLVNLHHVKNYIKGEGGAVTMSDGASVEVSRRKKDELLKRISSLQ